MLDDKLICESNRICLARKIVTQDYVRLCVAMKNRNQTLHSVNQSNLERNHFITSGRT